jgi:hypothetical protein
MNGYFTGSGGRASDSYGHEVDWEKTGAPGIDIAPYRALMAQLDDARRRGAKKEYNEIIEELRRLGYRMP